MQYTNQLMISKKFFNKIILSYSKAVRSIHTLRILGTISLLSLILSACSKTTNDTGSVEKSSNNDNNSNNQAILRIATEGAYPPFNYTNTDGSLAGFDVELAHALCANMQLQCEIVAQDWDGIIPGLKSKKYDAIIAAMSVTPERQEQVDFTDSYFNNSLIFLAKKSSTFNPDNIDDINNHSIAAQRSTISSQWLEQNYPKTQIRLHDTLNNAFLDLESGRVDAMVSDKAPALEWLKSDIGKNFAIKGKEIDIDDNFAIAVRKNDVLKDKLNTALADIKQNGTYQTLQDKYFSSDRYQDNQPSNHTTKGQIEDHNISAQLQ